MYVKNMRRKILKDKNVTTLKEMHSVYIHVSMLKNKFIIDYSVLKSLNIVDSIERQNLKIRKSSEQ